MGCCSSKNNKVGNETNIPRNEVGEKNESKADDKKPASNENNIRNMKRESNNNPSIEPEIDQEIRLNNHSIEESDNEQDNKSTESEYDSTILIVNKIEKKKIYVAFDNSSIVGSDIEEESMSIESDESEGEQVFNFEDEEEKFNSQSSSSHSSSHFSSDDSDPSPFQGNDHLSMFKNKRFTTLMD